MKKHLLFSLLAAASFSLQGNDGVYSFDFGTAASPLREGFIRVTPGKGSGYTWSSKGKLRAVANKILESQENKKRHSIEPPPVYFNDLSCDHVTGSAETVLTLKVPAGRYMAWAVCGHAGGRRIRDFVWNIQMGGQEINNWRNYAIRELVFPVKADGQGARITIKTKSAWLINALLLVPEKQWESFRKSDGFRSLYNEMFHLSDERLKQWKHRF